MCTIRMASRNAEIQELKDQWSAALQSYRQLQLDFKIMGETCYELSGGSMLFGGP